VELKATLDSTNAGTEILSTGTAVTASVEPSSAGTASMEMNSIMKLAMSYVGTEGTLVNMNVMTEIE